MRLGVGGSDSVAPQLLLRSIALDMFFLLDTPGVCHAALAVALRTSMLISPSGKPPG